MKEINRQSLTYEAGTYGVYFALTYAMITIFALAIGASRTEIGIISAIPFIALLLSQIPGLQLLQGFKRKFIIVAFDIIERALWIGVGVLLIIGFKLNVVSFMVLLFLMTFNAGLVSPSFNSLFGDVISKPYREDVLSKRQILGSGLGIIATLFGAYFLDLFPSDNFSGFGFLLIAGTLFGYLTIYFLSRIQEPMLKEDSTQPLSRKLATTPRFKKLLIYMGVFNFAFMFNSPFITVFRIQELGVSNGFILFLAAIGAVFTIFGSRHWAVIGKRFGDKSVQVITTSVIAITPLLNLLVPPDKALWLIPVEIIAYFFFAGVTLSGYNLFLGMSDSKHRATQTALLNVVISISLIIAPILAGIISDEVILLGVGGSALVLVLGSVMRAFTLLFLLPIKEPQMLEEEDHFDKVLMASLHFQHNGGLRTFKKLLHRG